MAVIGFETNDSTLASMCTAFAHLRDPRAVPLLVARRGHADEDVRLSVVHGLTTQRAPAAIEALIELSADVDEDVRNWATFGLGSMTDVDSPALRDALFARIGDPHLETRGEALAGLALTAST